MKKAKLAHQTLFFSLAISLSFISAMSFLFYTGNKIATHQAPLIDAAMEVKLELTTAHLWFEEIISGDRNESIETVWNHIENAEWYAEAILSGGTNIEGTFLPVTDPHMRDSVLSIQKSLKRFRKIAEQRYQDSEQFRIGSAMDQEFDRVFAEVIGEADHVETMIQKDFAIELEQFQMVSGSMLAALAMLSIFLSIFLYRREIQRMVHLKTIHKAHKSIKKKNSQLKLIAHYDQLTGLPNRVLFLDRLERELAHAKRQDSVISLLFVDLDKFKSVNDHLGHYAGDILLQQVAMCLKKCVREDDSVIRLNGDEFVVLLCQIGNREDALDASCSVAGKILKQLNQPFNLDGKSAHISASIGIAVSPEDGSTSDLLLRNADTAMYHAKAQGKNNYQFFSKQLNEMALKRAEIEEDLRTAILEKQFLLYFQPQMNFAHQSFMGVEVLVRWEHPERGLIMPNEFIPVAESCGLIQTLDSLISKMAFEQYQQWQQKRFNVGRLALNISPISFRRPDFVTDIVGYITRYEISAHNVELELIESVLVENTQRTQKILSQLCNLGVRIAIDDFGTGYSSMAYLKDFPVNTLKIDRTFILGYDESDVGKAILKNIVSLANDLNLEIVAEGIETKEQESFVRALGCQIGQGYWFAKPMTAQQLEQFAQKMPNNVLYLDVSGESRLSEA